jgi:GH24 family phage-related lysozyme (muramidase)
MAQMKTSESGVHLIKRFEGLHKKTDEGDYRSYRCPAGRWTIGVGHIKGVRSGMRATENECMAFLKQDLQVCEDAVENNVKVEVSQNQFDSLVSFVFNLGETNFRKSTLLAKLNKNQFDDVPAEFLRWNKARVGGELTVLKGLTRRRTAEAALFTMDVPLPDDDEKEVMAQKPEPTSVKPLKKSKTIAGAATAGTGTLGSLLTEAAGNLQSLVHYAETLKIVFLVLSVAGIALVTYARLGDHNKGIN